MQGKGIGRSHLPLQGGQRGRRQGPAFVCHSPAPETLCKGAGGKVFLGTNGLSANALHQRRDWGWAGEKGPSKFLLLLCRAEVEPGQSQMEESSQVGDAGRKEDQGHGCKDCSWFLHTWRENVAISHTLPGTGTTLIQPDIELLSHSLTDHIEQPIMSWLGLLQAERKYRFEVSHAAEGTEARSSVSS